MRRRPPRSRRALPRAAQRQSPDPEARCPSATSPSAFGNLFTKSANGQRRQRLGARQYCTLLQRILPNRLHPADAIQGFRIGAASVREGALLHPPSVQQSRQAVVSLDAARLVIDPVLLLALPGELLLHGPGPGPHGRILDQDLIRQSLWPGACPALDQMQILARPEHVGLGTEVGHVDHERIAFPMAAGVAEPLPDAGRQVRTSVHDDIALPALALIHVVEDRDATRRLHNSAKAAAEQAAELGQPAAQAAVRQAVVLRTIAAVEARDVAGVVARRIFRKARRGRRAVLTAGANWLLVLARVSRLQQREEEFPVGRGGALGCGSLRRHTAIGRIDDHRRARADALDGQELYIVGAADVDRASTFLTWVLAIVDRALLVQLLPLRLREEFLVSVAGGAL